MEATATASDLLASKAPEAVNLSPPIDKSPRNAPKISTKTVESILTATRENFYLHVGYGLENSLGKKLGESIKLTVVNMSLLGFSFQVNGKSYTANTDSLRKHFRSIGIEDENVLERMAKIGYEALI